MVILIVNFCALPCHVKVQYSSCFSYYDCMALCSAIRYMTNHFQKWGVIMRPSDRYLSFEGTVVLFQLPCTGIRFSCSMTNHFRIGVDLMTVRRSDGSTHSQGSGDYHQQADTEWLLWMCTPRHAVIFFFVFSVDIRRGSISESEGGLKFRWHGGGPNDARCQYPHLLGTRGPFEVWTSQ